MDIEMQSLWDDALVSSFSDSIEFRVYSSQLLGKDKTLVLHGGGNTSVKVTEKNLFGEDVNILYVKGSGWDLEFIEEAGYAPVHLDHLKRLVELPSLTDPEMVNELVTHMTKSTAPVPSVEAILHAIIPHKYVDHTHADSVITITNSNNGEKRIRDIYGEQVIVVPYVMPGFDLAQLCSKYLREELKPDTIGMVLLNHGIFTFGDTAKESYERMIELVTKAEVYIHSKKAWRLKKASSIPKANVSLDIAKIRQQISKVVGHPMILIRNVDLKIMSFVTSFDLKRVACQGPATPDHVIRTKRLPMIGRNIENYITEYKAYFKENVLLSKGDYIMLDPAPRVVLDPDIGLCTVGRSVNEAKIVADIYKHTIDIIQRSEILGGYKALSAKEIFDVEYWDLEQAKLRKSGSLPIFTGEVALVTGASSGIGKACVDSLLSRGAVVVGLDINENVKKIHSCSTYLGIVCDVTVENELNKALEITVNAFGGLDILVLNAGIFPGGCKISDLNLNDWRKVMDVNLDASFTLMSASHSFLKLSPMGGRVVIIGSKNVPAPGPGAAAYSASKSALNQLARVAALEWGEDNIRVNSVHPNAVFDTGLWTEEVLTSRAKHYGLTVEQYKTNNVLKTEIRSFDVAELVSEMCGPLFSKTTGAQVPIDGGNDRVI